MKLPKYLTTVTTFSKTLALFLFIIFPILGFVLGMNYQKELDNFRSYSQILTPILQKPRSKIISYTVVNGDTTQSISDKFEISLNTIKWANNLNSNSVVPGQTLYILPVTGIVHKVLPGDTIDSLAKKYHTTQEKIKDFPFNNFSNIETFTLILGDNLIIPDGTK